MTDADQDNNVGDPQAAPAGDANDAAPADAVWITADALPYGDVIATPVTDADLPGDQYLHVADTIASEAVGSVDHALHQLTVTTDLFDVPVIDFHDHGS